MKAFVVSGRGLVLALLAGAASSIAAFTATTTTTLRTPIGAARAVASSPPPSMGARSNGRFFLSTTNTKTTTRSNLPLRMSSNVAEQSEADKPTEEKKGGAWNKFKKAIPPANERQKLIPLALMFFCILFNYTILRDTKDVLMVTAPKSGAEVIVRRVLLAVATLFASKIRMLSNILYIVALNNNSLSSRHGSIYQSQLASPVSMPK